MAALRDRTLARLRFFEQQRLDGGRGIKHMPKSGARPAAATTEERYIRHEAAALLVFQLQAVDNRPT
ncbi:MAG: hypothetical protein OXF54_22965 [Caldilineaceae bacterium]|nr:hypothetical protein [Caldilineaceae bacterium]